MIKAELSYNPYVLETKVMFNGQKPKINSLVEKYEKGKLQSWLNKIRGIFYDEMNGYDFDLDFSGTKVDYEALKKVFFEDHLITIEDVRIFHKNELESVLIKNNEIDHLLHWIEVNPNRRFDYVQFREENRELFDDNYSFLLIQGNLIDTSVYEAFDVSVEKIDALEEIPDDLSMMPILFYLDEHTYPKFESFLCSVLQHVNVIQEQLFFFVHPELNVAQTERNIRDLGIYEPQLVNGLNDDRITKYMEVYPMTNYIYSSIKAFRSRTDAISILLEEENEKSKRANAFIYENIEELETVIAKLKEAYHQFAQRDNLEFPYAFETDKKELIRKVKDWRKKKVKIDNDIIAERVMNEFMSDLESYFEEYVKSAELKFEFEKRNIDIAYQSIYNKAEYCDDFQVTEDGQIDLSGFHIPDMVKDFKLCRKEEIVPKQEDIFDILNPFVKRDPNAPIEMVSQITYLYQQLRDIAVVATELITMEINETIFSALSEYYNNCGDEYTKHLEFLIVNNVAEKEKISAQLSEDEQALQNDNDWLLAIVDQLKIIERG